MAENAKVGIDLVADTRSLRSQLRESVQELARLQNTAGASAQEIANAAKRAAELLKNFDEIFNYSRIA